jgi:predicted transcriptional regulator
MAIQVQQLIEGREKPICITRDEPVTNALTQMINYEYSQLSVTRMDGEIDILEGMVTYESILRGIRKFKAKLDELKVRDVMINVPIFQRDDDLFDMGAFHLSYRGSDSQR